MKLLLTMNSIFESSFSNYVDTDTPIDWTAVEITFAGVDLHSYYLRAIRAATVAKRCPCDICEKAAL